MITRKDVFEEIVSPKELEKIQEPNMLGLIYKAVYMCIRLLLDIRSNQNKIATKLGFQLNEKPTETQE